MQIQYICNIGSGSQYLHNVFHIACFLPMRWSVNLTETASVSSPSNCPQLIYQPLSRLAHRPKLTSLSSNIYPVHLSTIIRHSSITPIPRVNQYLHRSHVRTSPFDDMLICKSSYGPPTVRLSVQFEQNAIV